MVGCIDKLFSHNKKVKYPSEDSADRALQRHKKKNDLEYYKCRHCEGWHIGHKKGAIRDSVITFTFK